MRGEIDEAEKKREELKTLLRRRRGMEALEVEAQRKESERARREVTLAGFMCAAAPTSKRRPALNRCSGRSHGRFRRFNYEVLDESFNAPGLRCCSRRRNFCRIELSSSIGQIDCPADVSAESAAWSVHLL